MQLRPYQERAVEDTVRLFKRHRSLLGVAPARSGKTVIALEIAKRVLEPNQRLLFASHMSELVDQPLTRIHQSYPELQPAGAVQGKRRDVNARAVCGTVQTLKNCMDEVGPVDLLIIDEAHHALSATHLRIIERARYLNPMVKILYITATPHRADGLGLRDVCEAVGFIIPLGKLIRQGYLVEPIPYPIPLYNVDLDGVRKRGGDFVAGDLGRRMDTPEVNRRIVDTWLKVASSRKTLVYTATVKHAEALVEMFVHAGVKAEVVSGSTKNTAEVQERFTNGSLQVVANALKWTEGVDIPPVSCVIMARPLAASRSMYIQSATRGMTASPGKTDCLIMDVIPQYSDDLLNYKVITADVSQPLAPLREAVTFINTPGEKEQPKMRGALPPPARKPLMRSWASLQFEQMLKEHEHGSSS
jgi:superfamily II DNA or RNA helicase